MKPVGMRSLRGPLAILIAFVLVVSGVFFASPHFAARAEAPPTNHTNRADIVVSDFVMKRWGGGSDKTGVAGPVYLNESALITWKWSLDDTAPRPQPGDSLRVGVPVQLNINETNKFDFMWGDQKIGTCYPERKAITCIFENQIDFTGRTGVGGSGYFAAAVVDKTGTTINFDGNGVPREATMPEGQAVEGRRPKQWVDQPLHKSHDGVPSDARFLRWYVVFSGRSLKAAAEKKGQALPNPIVIKDTLEGPQTFTDITELYIIQTKENPELPWTTLVGRPDATGGDSTPSVPGRFPDDFELGSFKIDTDISPDRKTATYRITKLSGEWQDDVNYKFLYITKHDGKVVDGVVLKNNVELSDGQNEPFFRQVKSAGYTASAGATAVMQDNYGSFRVSKTLGGPKRDAVLADPARKAMLNVHWTLPVGRQATDYPGWTAPENPVKMPLAFDAVNPYPNGGDMPFPVGTTIRLVEDAAGTNPALPSDVVWGEPLFTVGDQKGKNEISFVIESQKVTTVQLENTAKLTPSVSVGNYVWFDENKNGKQDDTESGLAGAVLKLTYDDDTPVTNVEGQPVTDLTTKADGRYVFDKLPPLTGAHAGKKYKVTMVTPPPGGYIPTEADTAGVTVDLNSSTDWVLSQGPLEEDLASDMTLDFGFIKPAVSVGNFVWFDADKDGLQGDGEPGIEGVTLTISRSDDATVNGADGQPLAVLTTVTNPQGEYSFTGLEALPAGTHYVVSVTAPAGYQATKDKQGADTEKDSEAGAGKAESKDLTTDGASDMSLDFGFIKPAVSVGNFVWFDSDKDGLQGDGEPGIEGVTLTISRSDGAAVNGADGQPLAALTTKTNEQGLYSFENLQALPAGTHYVVSVTAPAGYQATKDKQGADTEKDSEAGAGKAESADLTTDGASDMSLDFGFIKPAVSVGNFVWFDSDKDGLQGDGEPGIEGVTLTISRSDGAAVNGADGQPLAALTTKTNEQGLYSFENLQALPAGTHYVVKVTDLPRGWVATSEAGDDDPAKDSDAKAGKAESADLTTDGASDMTLDFGYVRAAVSVGDFVWFDSNKNGLQDDGEPGIEGATLTISRTDGKPVVHVDDVDKADAVPVAAIVTKADGAYLFENLPVLPAGVKYVVSVQVPAKYTPTVEAGDDDPAKDSDAQAGKATAQELTVDGASDRTLDFGFVNARVSVGDFVWFDSNKDGKQDAGEPGLAGVELTIFGPDGQKVAVDADGKPYNAVLTTKGDGKYLFENLPVLADAERYSVEVTRFPYDMTPTIAQAPGTDPTNDSATGSDQTIKPLVADGRVDDTLDFGFVKATVSVGDFVWFDSNKDGKQDADEPGVEGIELTLTGPDGKPVVDVDGNPVGVATTDKDGKYTFGNLPVLQPGQSYTVSIAYPAQYTHTVAQAEGTTRDNDSSTGSESSGDLLEDGDQDLSLDFGLVYATVSVGDFVWFDSNGNGRQDAGEPGIAGVELTLTGPDGKSVTDVDGKVVPVVTTDKDGKYVFEKLPVLKDGQKYTVSVKVPSGYVATKPNATGDVSNDSSSGSVSSVSLVKHGDQDMTLDFGFVKVKDPVPGKVAKTGADAAVAGGIAVLIVAAGAAGVWARRRMTR
ncbi:SdrD B-like domain-containing protein [Schaalia sp. Marseille-Q2122]|uniref:SdrD B-like domain-containing protein n=1 Tax=Schaalia sp. Marseille-Q2122 TaxID=2736604 RepID=UPI001C379C5D|nr:SdrD B-like domain-containing protein [Schaalia sp. Marseille-Q2122]